jgi:polysaccharide pyruvyl transferase WcaK-like protein
MGMPGDDTAKAKPKMKIGHLGTFDVENYGDLLFPMLAERRLQSRIPELILDPISPVGSESVWQDSPSSIGYDDFSKHREGYRGFLVGGGNIIRVTPSDLDMYQTDPFFSYSNLWAGIAALNENNNLPICWNSPGVPSSLPVSLWPRLRSYLERVNYLCVRDEMSRDFLREVAPDLEISVTPDPAWDIDKIWTAEALEAAYCNAFLSRQADVPDRSVVIHLNSRYLGEAAPEELGAHLDALCRGLNATGILIAIGPCHGDDVLASSVAAQMKTKPLLINRPAGLKETAACIARSVAYIGSSMHGFITASSFCIPAVVVASSSMIKFPGMLSQIGLPNLIHQTWPGAVEHVMQLGSPDYLLSQRAARHPDRAAKTAGPSLAENRGYLPEQPQSDERRTKSRAVALKRAVQGNPACRDSDGNIRPASTRAETFAETRNTSRNPQRRYLQTREKIGCAEGRTIHRKGHSQKLGRFARRRKKRELPPCCLAACWTHFRIPSFF